MASLDDLKGQNKSPVKKPFIPQVSSPTDPTATKQRGKMPVSMTVLSSIPDSSEEKTPKRQSLDLSSIPNPENTGGLEVKTYNSIEDQIFGEGGPFDKYKEEKTKEMIEWVREREERAQLAEAEGVDPRELEAEEKGEKVPENIKSKKDNTMANIEPIEKDINVTLNPTKELKEVDILKGRKPKVQDKTNNNEEVKEEANTATIPESDYFDTEDEEDDQYVTEVEKVEKPTEEIEVPKKVIDLREDEKKPVEEKKETEKVEEKNNSSNSNQVIEREVVSYNAPVDKDEDDAATEVETDDMTLLKDLITEKLKDTIIKKDISNFTILSKGTTSNNILETSSAAMAKWPLPATGVVIQMREISGAYLESIQENLERSVPDVRTALKIIYDHIVSPKPTVDANPNAGFEIWLKSTAAADYDHLFFAAYIAAFSEANYMPVDCGNSNCKQKTYLTDNIPMLDMVKFKDSDCEKKFWDLYYSEPVNPSGLYTTKVIPISDKFAFAFKEPSIYSTMLEANYFNDQFRRQYGQTVNYLPYIDNIYVIDWTNNSLQRVEFKEYANNLARTARSRVQRYHKIIQTFTADQNAILGAYINKITERTSWFTYKIPATTCPSCGHVNSEVNDQSPASLLFLRNRLGVLANI